MTTPNPNLERIEELMAIAAIEGLSREQEIELRQLGVSDAELQQMELAAAAAHIALLDHVEPMPEAIRSRIISQASIAGSLPSAPTSSMKLTGDGARPSGGRPGTLAMVGWLVAIAASLLAVVAWWPAAPVVQPDVRRQAILASADVLRATWADWGDEPAVAGVQGDVVWSPSRQEGYMRFRGLAANDPTREQYQLWIVDGARGEPLQVPPVDGGVFNVTDTGEVIVPINAKLPVGQAVAFAITVEPPGGVVVSDRSRRVVVAMVGQ